jgi:hypothetical protein
MAVDDGGELSSVAPVHGSSFATVDTIQFRPHLSNYHADRTKSLLMIGEQSPGAQACHECARRLGSRIPASRLAAMEGSGGAGNKKAALAGGQRASETR